MPTGRSLGGCHRPVLGAAKRAATSASVRRGAPHLPRLEGPHIRSPAPRVLQMVARPGPAGLASWRLWARWPRLWRTLGRHFTDPRLRQLFGRYATYCGGSPWLAPATLMLVAHVEQNGVWSVRGGMHALAQALAGWPRRGAELRYGTPVQRILVRRRPRLWRAARRRPGAARRLRGLQRRCAGAGRAAGRRTAARGTGRAAAAFAVGLTWAVHARTHGFSRWRATTSSSTTTTAASSTTSSATAACRARHGLRLRAGPGRDARGPKAAPPSGCCAWSMPLPTATAGPSTRRRPTHAKTTPWTCCATAACS
jgi:phytoene dehydrogenase-like protein